MLTGLAQAVAQLGGPHSSDQDQARRAMREAVMGVLDRIPTEIRQRPELERSFLDFINLPVWKRRHEVYAVWVGTRIGKAIDPWEPHYQPDGDVLRFPFSGARLASLSANAEPLEFWTELRTSLQKPVSGKRKGSIQPDYRIAAVPVKTPESSKLVVECKQYKKASAANFSNALNDYASGCPNAAVLLVNYGPVTDRVRVHVREDFRDRTHVIPYFRPRNFAVLEEFSLCVSGAISPLGASGSGLKGGSGRVVLRWSGRLEDLDLYIGIPNHEGKSYLVYYMAQNQGDAEPFMRLSPDIRQGPGLERVDVAQWMPCIYEIYVHNFSRIGVMTNDATVTVSTLPGAPLHMFRCHAEGSGAWWHVCSIDGASGRITKVDRLEGVPSALPGIGP
jgi:uncharacterized protein YfaP (DUF2135 family)